MSMLLEGQKVLIIRYGKRTNCIEEHQAVIDELGYCWFGKIGVVPSAKAIKTVMEEDNPAVVLFSKGKAYVGVVEDVVYEKPKMGYPDYYIEELYKQSVYPKSYYKLVSLERMSSEELSKLKIVSSGNLATITLNKSMSSFFFAEYGKSVAIPVRETPKKTKKKLDSNDCTYKKDGLCMRKGFVNYKYECERPSMCIGQKC